jgi:hypothetical protein
MKREVENNSQPQYPNQDRIHKIKRIAYHLWINRLENNISGSADQDYFQAERIYDSYTARRQQSLGSLCVWTVAFLAAQSPEPHYLNAAKAAVVFESLAKEYDLI